MRSEETDRTWLWIPSDSRTDSRVNSLRILFRHLLAFRSLHEADGTFEITAPTGQTWSLFDIEYLYSAAMRRPIDVTGTLRVAEDLAPGFYVQLSGVWSLIEGVHCDVKTKSKPLVLALSQERVKRFACEASVLSLSPQEKRLLDHNKANPCLPLRQQQAIELFLVLNLPEAEAAVRMGLAPTNPVGMYATSGLTRLLKLMDEGYLPRFADDGRMLSVA